jgi:hypothetical protein
MQAVHSRKVRDHHPAVQVKLIDTVSQVESFFARRQDEINTMHLNQMSKRLNP